MKKTHERGIFIVRSRPAPYPLTDQQLRFKGIAEFCGIKKGITRAELIDKMINCIPQFWREHAKNS